MPGFIQIVEFSTTRIDEVEVVAEQFRVGRAASGDTLATKATVTADREQPGRYFSIVEFDSYEAAMANSERPDTAEFAAKMAELCDGPPRFHNLDVRQIWEG
jgi:quinol monooxygenase YgiN